MAAPIGDPGACTRDILLTDATGRQFWVNKDSTFSSLRAAKIEMRALFALTIPKLAEAVEDGSFDFFEAEERKGLVNEDHWARWLADDLEQNCEVIMQIRKGAIDGLTSPYPITVDGVQHAWKRGGFRCEPEVAQPEWPLPEGVQYFSFTDALGRTTYMRPDLVAYQDLLRLIEVIFRDVSPINFYIVNGSFDLLGPDGKPISKDISKAAWQTIGEVAMKVHNPDEVEGTEQITYNGRRVQWDRDGCFCVPEMQPSFCPGVLQYVDSDSS